MLCCGSARADIDNALSEMSARRAQGVPQASGNFAVEAMMDVQQGAEAVLHMASLSLSANVQFMTIMATKMRFVGQG